MKLSNKLLLSGLAALILLTLVLVISLKIELGPWLETFISHV